MAAPRLRDPRLRAHDQPCPSPVDAGTRKRHRAVATIPRAALRALHQPSLWAQWHAVGTALQGKLNTGRELPPRLLSVYILNSTPRAPEWSTAQGPIAGPATIATPLGQPDPVVVSHGRYRALGQSELQRQAAYRGLFTVHVNGGQLGQIREAWQDRYPLGQRSFQRAGGGNGRAQGRPSPTGQTEKDGEEYPVKGSDPFMLCSFMLQSRTRGSPSPIGSRASAPEPIAPRRV